MSEPLAEHAPKPSASTTTRERSSTIPRTTFPRLGSPFHAKLWRRERVTETTTRVWFFIGPPDGVVVGTIGHIVEGRRPTSEFRIDRVKNGRASAVLDRDEQATKHLQFQFGERSRTKPTP